MNFVPNHVLVILDEAYFELAQNEEDYQTRWTIDMTMSLH